MFSVVILTFNESLALPDCLRSLRGCEEIFVLDSGSTDDTQIIAKSFGAQLFTHPFESFGRQRQWAMENLPFKYEWVLFLDADERATPGFLAAVFKIISTAPPGTVAYDCCWKLLLQGQWLRFSDGFPRYQTRLVRRGRIIWGDWGHGQKLASCDGLCSKISQPYLHDAFIHGWDNWWKKHERYARQEAEAMSGVEFPADNSSSRSGDHTTKLKTTLRLIPFWPLLFFLARFIFCLGFLDGSGGFIWCYNRARFEALVLKNYRLLKKR